MIALGRDEYYGINSYINSSVPVMSHSYDVAFEMLFTNVFNIVINVCFNTVSYSCRPKSTDIYILVWAFIRIGNIQFYYKSIITIRWSMYI